jgi:flagellar hook-associated protein FlgK
LDDLSTDAGTINNSGVLTLGVSLPKRTTADALSWPNGNAVETGEIVSFVDPNAVTGSPADFYMVINPVDAASDELPNTSLNFVKINSFEDDTVKTVQSLPQAVDNDGVLTNQIEFLSGEIYYDEPSETHFLVNAKPDSIIGDVEIGAFNPNDAKWSNNFHVFSPDPASGLPPTSVLRKASPGALNTSNGSLQELNIGVAEAIIQNGEIKSFNILQQSNGLPSTDSLFVNGEEVTIKSGSVHGYQEARRVELEDYRTSLNSLVSKFVKQVNEIYNPNDAPGGYLFGFEANLTRPTMGSNLIMEEQFGLFGVEGNGELNLFRNEVNMTLPYSEGDTFTITNTTPIVPVELKDQFEGTGYIIRDTPEGQVTLEDPNSGSIYTIYGAAKNMQNVTMESDSSYPGEDLLIGTDDDGRSIMLAYENIPFRLEQGGSEFILGDNFTFNAVLENEWNLASSLIVDNDLSVENLVASLDFDQGSNDIALKIAELGNGEFSKDISDINADIGNSLSDLNDNIDHQKTIEDLLLEQRNAVSSVSIDEEVADLMQFQRSFQASSRVLNTLDKMLELVVMGLIK